MIGICIVKSQSLLFLLVQVFAVFAVAFTLGKTTLSFTLLLLVLLLVLFRDEHLFDSVSSPAPNSWSPASISNMQGLVVDRFNRDLIVVIEQVVFVISSFSKVTQFS